MLIPNFYLTTEIPKLVLIVVRDYFSQYASIKQKTELQKYNKRAVQWEEQIIDSYKYKYVHIPGKTNVVFSVSWWLKEKKSNLFCCEERRMVM